MLTATQQRLMAINVARASLAYVTSFYADWGPSWTYILHYTVHTCRGPEYSVAGDTTCVPCSDILHGTAHTCTSSVLSVFPGLLSTAFQLTAYNYAKNILIFLMNSFTWF
jgi:hypothetical protein